MSIGAPDAQLLLDEPLVRPISVVLVDDESLVRTSLARAVVAARGLELLGEAASGVDALELVVALRPDVVLMDPQGGGACGVDVIERLGLIAPWSRVLVLTRNEPNGVVAAILAGAAGYLIKNATAETVLDAIRATAAGETVLSSQVAGALLQHIREQHCPGTELQRLTEAAIRATLTARELDVFARLASGNSNPYIARELSVSTNTVSNHIARILAKLRLQNRIQAAVLAVRSGIS